MKEQYRHLREKNLMLGFLYGVSDELECKHSGIIKKIRRGNIIAMTVAKITYPDDTRFFGLAFCSKRDNFTKKIGRVKALNRAKTGKEYSYVR